MRLRLHFEDAWDSWVGMIDDGKDCLGLLNNDFTHGCPEGSDNKEKIHDGCRNVTFP